jgi:hypothetical protein
VWYKSHTEQHQAEFLGQLFILGLKETDLAAISLSLYPLPFYLLQCFSDASE